LVYRFWKLWKFWRRNKMRYPKKSSLLRSWLERHTQQLTKLWEQEHCTGTPEQIARLGLPGERRRWRSIMAGIPQFLKQLHETILLLWSKWGASEDFLQIFFHSVQTLYLVFLGVVQIGLVNTSCIIVMQSHWFKQPLRN